MNNIYLIVAIDLYGDLDTPISTYRYGELKDIDDLEILKLKRFKTWLDEDEVKNIIFDLDIESKIDNTAFDEAL